MNKTIMENKVNISWIKEPGEHVKLIISKLIDLQEQMERKTPSSKVRQLEEIGAIKNIFGDDRCLEYSEGHLDIEVIFDIHTVLPEREIQVSYVYENPLNLKTPVDFGSLFLEHLSPIRFYLKFPSSYPSEKPPDFTLDIPWLTPWESSKICERLDELWTANEGSEILFIWIDFLKNHLLAFLNIQEKIDISFHVCLFRDKDDQFYQKVVNWRDSRVSKPACRCPINFLENFDQDKRVQKFEKRVHFCEICLVQNSGSRCTALKMCKHVFCTICLEEYFNTRIKDGFVMKIPCPICSIEVQYDEIKNICNEKVFRKFEEWLLIKTLSTMKDTVPCPRKYCGYPVIRDNLEEDLAICVQCKYSFCVFCRKLYHGISPCEMSTEEKNSLVIEYQKASKSEKKLLELRYGKKQIRIVVERFLTKKYLKENSKPCPNCLTQTIKADGCNKMTCSYCQKSFCWLCGKLIDSKNPYSHFSKMRNVNSPCGGRLFDGLFKELELLDEREIDANFEFFMRREANN